MLKSSRSSLIALMAVVALVAVFVAAGFWQLRRAEYKEVLQAQMERATQDAPISLGPSVGDATQLNFRTLSVRGRWLADKTIFIDNKVEDGVVGYQVVTPLRIAGGSGCVLVNRGWLAAPRLRTELPEVATPDGEVEIVGIARIPTTRFLELSGQNTTGRVWQNLTVERFAQWSGLRLQPVLIYQQNPDADRLKRVPPAPEASGINAARHRAYALMWFSFAAIVIFGAFAFSRSTHATHRNE